MNDHIDLAALRDAIDEAVIDSDADEDLSVTALNSIMGAIAKALGRDTDDA